MKRLPLVLLGSLAVCAAVTAQPPHDTAPSASKAITTGGLRLLALPEFFYKHVTTAGLRPGHGVLIDQIDPDSRAAADGLQLHDILVTFDGAAIRDTAHFQKLLQAIPPEKRVALGLIREGKAMRLSAALTPATAADSSTTVTVPPSASAKPVGPPAVSVEAQALDGNKLRITFVFDSAEKGKLDRLECSGSIDEIRKRVTELNRQNRIPANVQDLVGAALDRIKALNSPPDNSP